MNVIVSTSSSRDKAKTAVKRARTTPKNNEHTMAISRVTYDIDDEIVDEKPIASLPSEAKNTSNSKKSHSRYLYMSKYNTQIWNLTLFFSLLPFANRKLDTFDAPLQFNSFPAG